jgi:hypothetical protein
MKIRLRFLLKMAGIKFSVLLMLSASLCASVITYSTNVAGTGFSGNGLVLNDASGVLATLAFIPDANITTGVPSNVNFGNFTLTCSSCSTQALGAGTYFAPFTFDLVLTDVSDGASGKFVGTSTGGLLYSDASNLTITWSPLQLGPATLNSLGGTFGLTEFSTTVFTGIVAPNSGTVPGQSTVQGYVSAASAPEPTTLFMASGALLLSLGIFSRKRHLSSIR